MSKKRKFAHLTENPSVELIDDATPEFYSRPSAQSLLHQIKPLIVSSKRLLEDARVICARHDLSIDSSILDATFQASTQYLPIPQATGGHFNTDHVVKETGDPRRDRISELKRAFQRRARSIQPENKGEDRWDTPRIRGSRRRRIARDKDLPSAPPEPPLSGYVLYLFQITVKIRHDRKVLQNRTDHNQRKIVQYASRMWNCGMNDEERGHYLTFAEQAKLEYQYQIRQYRATGAFVPSRKFVKLGGNGVGMSGPWIHKNWEDMNDLEREISMFPIEEFQIKPDHRLKANKTLDKDQNSNADNQDSVEENTVQKKTPGIQNDPLPN